MFQVYAVSKGDITVIMLGEYETLVDAEIRMRLAWASDGYRTIWIERTF